MCHDDHHVRVFPFFDSCLIINWTLWPPPYPTCFHLKEILQPNQPNKFAPSFFFFVIIFSRLKCVCAETTRPDILEEEEEGKRVDMIWEKGYRKHDKPPSKKITRRSLLVVLLPRTYLDWIFYRDFLHAISFFFPLRFFYQFHSSPIYFSFT